MSIKKPMIKFLERSFIDTYYIYFSLFVNIMGINIIIDDVIISKKAKKNPITFVDIK